jgi:hypothetical protein
MYAQSCIHCTYLSGLAIPPMAEKPAAVMVMKITPIKSAVSTLAVKYFDKPREMRTNSNCGRGEKNSQFDQHMYACR